MNNKNPTDLLKIVLISSLVSLNIVVWYEIFGGMFARPLLIVILLILFFDKNAG